MTKLSYVSLLQISAAICLPYPKSMFAPLVFPPSTQHQEQQQSLLYVHRYGNTESGFHNSVNRSRNGNGNGLQQRQDGNGKTAPEQRKRNAGNQA